MSALAVPAPEALGVAAPEALAVAAAVLALGLFVARRVGRYLQPLQQEEYDARRFLAWLARTRAVDRRGSLVALAAAVTCAAAPELAVPAAAAAACVLVGLARSEPDPRTSGKVRLVLTPRARRIRRVASALALGAVGAAALVGTRVGPGSGWLAAALAVQLPPLALAAAVQLLAPGEARRQAALVREARARLESVAPHVVGVTGSYGKTSTKEVLGAMLECVGPTLRPPGSVNTLMGITRVLREDLRADHRLAVLELAAYREGSIARLCEHVRPRTGLVTNIGVMHLERFGSPEAVYRAKTELPAALPDGALCVLNADDAGCRRAAREHRRLRIVRYGIDAAPEGVDFHMRDLVVGPEGTSFTIRWEGRDWAGRTPLLGRAMLSNVLGAFATAASLGANPDYCLAVARNLRPVKNRLQLERDGEVLWLHDAHNSNPQGFRAALEVLAGLPAERRILVTPGMVELGPQQADANRAVAAEAARVCDRVLVVGRTNRAALLAGLGERGPDEVELFEDRDGALSELRASLRAGDAVLIENDLPDLYEPAARF